MHNEIIKETYTITDDTRRFDFNDDCHIVCVFISQDRKKITFGYYKGDKARAVLAEAAARLRRPTPVDDDLLKMARDIDKLRAKLKVAEDALESAWMYADKLPHQWPLPERVRTKMRDALAAIQQPVADCNQLEGASNGE